MLPPVTQAHITIRQLVHFSLYRAIRFKVHNLMKVIQCYFHLVQPRKKQAVLKKKDQMSIDLNDNGANHKKNHKNYFGFGKRRISCQV